MTLSSVMILTVGHDSTPKCVHMLCMTLSSVLILTVGHDSIARCVCVCARVHIVFVLYEHVKVHSHRVHMYVFYKGQRLRVDETHQYVMALDTNFQYGLFLHNCMRKPNIHRYTLLHCGMELRHIHQKLCACIWYVIVKIMFANN